MQLHFLLAVFIEEYKQIQVISSIETVVKLYMYNIIKLLENLYTFKNARSHKTTNDLHI